MPQVIHPAASPRHAPRDYAQAPLNIYWEMTQACSLACRHCRLSAMPCPSPDELNFEHSVAFLHQIPEFGEPLPHLILTGGDPLERADLFLLIEEASRLGIGVSITPAATPMLTRDALGRLKAHGIEGLGLSLDGSTAARHDDLRRVPGTFDRTMQAIRWAQELEIPLQVNTLASAETVKDIPEIYELLQDSGVARWSLFFLISVGRGTVLQPLSPDDAERLMGWIYGVSRASSFVVSTTEAPSYRRVALQNMRASGMTGEQIKRDRAARGFGVRDGHGIVFVSHSGDICPAGFLPVAAGNVRRDRLADVYRNAPVFHALHHPEQFEGRCGACEYHAICGGSRARAYASTGNPLAADPLCEFKPACV
jgi:AdoMet-dependent heme synthase